MKGPALAMENPNSNTKLDIGLRIMTSYIPQSDLIVTRIDVKIKNQQFNVGFVSTLPYTKPTGNKISSENDLILPSEVIEGGLNIKTSKIELIKALKELISNIENV